MKYTIIILLGLLSSCFNNEKTKNSAETKNIAETKAFVNGIDVSHYNNVDWKKLSTYNNIKFVYIKACEGKTYKDPNRVINYNLAKKYGYKVGFYIYWRRNLSGGQQFKNYCESIKNLNPDLPVVLDIEEKNIGLKENQIKTMKQVEVFTELYKQKFNKMPIIYTWNDIAQKLHSINNHYKYWISIDPPIKVSDLNSKYSIDSISNIPCVMVQLGYTYINGNKLDVNYVKESFVK